jgi:hypothetical protein
MMSLQQTATEIRAVNLANEFNVFMPNDVSDDNKVKKIFALIRTEKSEAVEELRVGNNEEFVIELADVNIRILDFAGYSKFNTEIMDQAFPLLFDHLKFEDVELLAVILEDLEILIEDAKKYWFLNMSGVTFYLLGTVFKSLVALAEDLDVNLYDVIKLKNEKNKTRGKRHGNKKF